MGGSSSKKRQNRFMRNDDNNDTDSTGIEMHSEIHIGRKHVRSEMMLTKKAEIISKSTQNRNNKILISFSERWKQSLVSHADDLAKYL